MTSKTLKLATALFACAALAQAADFGGHVGYFGTDVKNADVGVNVMVPLGMFAIVPNIDYTRQNGAGLWFGNADLALRFGRTSGPMYWVGAGPTYGYVSNYSATAAGGPYAMPGSGRGQQYTPPPGTNPPGSNPPTTSTPPPPHTAFAQFGGTTRAWGWDANAGVSWKASSVRPYVLARYNQVHDLKTAGVAVGIRFGH